MTNDLPLEPPGEPPNPQPIASVPPESGIAEAPQRHDEPGVPVLANSDPGRPYRVAAWLVIVGSLSLAALFVSIPAKTYELDFRGQVLSDVRRIDFFELWRIQTRNLPSEHYDVALQVLFVACGALFVLGSAYLIWLAIVDVRPDPRPTPDRMAGAPPATDSGPA
jgi:hypothetical protein